jgi:hypothetical protein
MPAYFGIFLWIKASSIFASLVGYCSRSFLLSCFFPALDGLSLIPFLAWDIFI